MKIEIKEWESLSEISREKLLLRSEQSIAEVEENVQEIIETVKRKGDRAVREYTLRFDKVDMGSKPLRVSEQEIEKSEEMLSNDIKESLRFSVENVRRFHQRQKQEGFDFVEIREGVFAGERITPITSAGLYVPRGRGSFPSMVYMLAVPAKIAGVPRICMVTPPCEDGSVDPACLFAARLCGVDEIYRVGGVQAIAALAFGTESINPVVKVTGPGSVYVSAAKKLLYGVLDVGLPAGPSESVILADESADPEKITLDLLIEAEHGSDSSALLITPSRELAVKVAELIPDYIASLPEPRKTFVTDVFSGYGGIIKTRSMVSGAEVVNLFAPEHLQIQTRDPFQTLSLIKNAGEILLGDRVPFSTANYSVGANAVLPTGGKARTCSAVSVRDFIKYSSLVYLTEEGYNTLKPHVIRMADYEGFVAHGNALKLREKGDTLS